ncbi:MAG: META domain-containing protein [Sphingomonas sp.]|nr:META domain-containing protein [Sphingomonas sp.]RZV47770.1 MAG: META domain-containing protein [Sphingomonadaceae bacterium]
MIRIAFALPLLVLAACEAQEAPVPAPEPVEEAAPAQTLELPGNYQVVSYRNAPLPASTTMSAAIDGSQVAITSPCARMVWDYELDGNAVSFSPVSGFSGGCAANPTTFENGVADVMAKANIAMDMGERINISGSGGAIELESR